MNDNKKVVDLISRIDSLKNKDTGLIESISKISREIGKALDKSNDMVAVLGELYSIGEALDEISSTLNLLSINASIEATSVSSGNQSGEGFDSVAKQINETSDYVAEEIASFKGKREYLERSFISLEKDISSIKGAAENSLGIIGEGDEFLALLGELKMSLGALRGPHE